MIRGLVVIGISVVLVLTLFGANLAWAADRGPLDADHITESAAEANLYAEVQDEILAQVAEQDIELPYPGLEDRLDEILAMVITEDWIQSETERNIHNLYAHLHDGEALDIHVDLEGHRDHTEEVFRAEFSLADLDVDELDRLMANEESYRDERDEMRDQLLDKIGVTPEDGFGVPTIQGLLESETSYEQTRADIRSDIADEAVAALDADNGFGNDQLSRMYNDRDAYEEEQADFQQQEKQRIQEETDEELSDEELDQYYEDQQDEIIDRAAAEAEDEIEMDDGPDAAQAHVSDIARLTAEGLATDKPHDTFTDEYDQIVASIEDDVIADIEEHPGEYEDEIDEEVTAEIEAADVPDAVSDEIHGVADVTVTAITSDMTYEEYGTAYDDAVADVEAAAVEHIAENRGEYEDELEETAAGGQSFDDIPESIRPETDAVVDLIVEAVVTEMAYNPFMDELAVREEELGAALAEALFEEEMLPSRMDFTEDLERDAGDELELAGQIFNMVFPAALGLTAFSLVLLGGIFFLLRDGATTAIVGGVTAMSVGVPTYAVGAITPAMLRDELATTDLPAGIVEASIDVLDAVFFSLLAGQATVLAALGGISLVVGVVLHFDVVSLPTDD